MPWLGEKEVGTEALASPHAAAGIYSVSHLAWMARFFLGSKGEWHLLPKAPRNTGNVEGPGSRPGTGYW